MKKFLKKANRGLLLSAIVLAIMVVYVISDYVSFQSQKDTINQVINNYYKAIYESNTAPEGLSKEHYDEVKKIIDTYWSEEDSSLLWATDKALMMSYASEIYTATDSVLDVSNVDFNIKNMKIKKSGPGYAMVTLSCSISITGNANSYALTPSNCRILSEDYYDSDEYEDGEEDSSDEKNTSDKSTPRYGTLNYSGSDITIEMHKEDGTWKICAINAYSDSSSFHYSDEN